MANRKKAPDAEDLAIVDEAPDITSPPAPALKFGPDAVTDEFTRCFRVRHDRYGHAEIFADDKEEAIAVFIEKRASVVDTSGIAEQCRVDELPFVPAETERHKPGGWPRRLKGRLRDINA